MVPPRARPEAEPTSFDAAGRPVLRCAIYTRQSVTRGEQDLTSCDVQRERCEDYVRAMQYEGWVALDERFDDLGVSGGSLERPRRRLPVSVGRRRADFDPERASHRFGVALALAASGASSRACGGPAPAGK